MTITGPNFNHTAHIGPGGNPDFTLTLPSQYGDATYTATATVNGQQVEDHKTVTVFSATLTKSGSFSADDDTQNNLPPLAPGETIHYNANTNYNDGGHHAPTELKLVVQPGGLHLDLAPFDILQTYHLVKTVTEEDGTSADIPQDFTDPSWPHFPGYRDADNPSGDVVYFMDGPGIDAEAVPDVQNFFVQDPNLRTFHAHFDFTVYPIYIDDTHRKWKIGPVTNWSADITATKQAGGTLAWS